MALVPIKTASTTGYCDCIHGCYELASLRDEDTGKGYCPACAKDHRDWNAGVGIPHPAPTKVVANVAGRKRVPDLPAGADPPGRLR
jgi:transposase